MSVIPQHLQRVNWNAIAQGAFSGYISSPFAFDSLQKVFEKAVAIPIRFFNLNDTYLHKERLQNFHHEAASILWLWWAKREVLQIAAGHPLLAKHQKLIGVVGSVLIYTNLGLAVTQVATCVYLKTQKFNKTVYNTIEEFQTLCKKNFYVNVCVVGFIFVMSCIDLYSKRSTYEMARLATFVAFAFSDKNIAKIGALSLKIIGCWKTSSPLEQKILMTWIFAELGIMAQNQIQNLQVRFQLSSSRERERQYFNQSPFPSSRE